MLNKKPKYICNNCGSTNISKGCGGHSCLFCGSDDLRLQIKENKNRFKIYKCAPEDSSLWKCNWLKCAGGMGLAGNGYCSFRGQWENKDCPQFISSEDFDIKIIENRRKKKYKRNIIK